jgi:hypothetical protein
MTAHKRTLGVSESAKATEPIAILSADGSCGLLAVRAGLLLPSSLGVASNCAGGIRDWRNGSAQAENREGGEDQVGPSQIWGCERWRGILRPVL